MYIRSTLRAALSYILVSSICIAPYMSSLMENTTPYRKNYQLPNQTQNNAAQIKILIIDIHPEPNSRTLLLRDTKIKSQTQDTPTEKVHANLLVLFHTRHTM
jgi:hypothetical protein